jgi:xyloglucan-specific exo-beta-1,4-glucanase
VPGQPSGLMPHHAALDASGVLYLSYGNAPGPNSLTSGAIWKLAPASGQWTEITPLAPDSKSPFGYGGLALDAQHPGTLLVSTLDYWRPDEIFRSVNGGQSWREVGAGVRDCRRRPILVLAPEHAHQRRHGLGR